MLTKKTKIEDMEIGDYIPCKYTAASGTAGTFSELGTCIATEIPVVGSATPNGLFNFIKVDKGLLIADRVVQQSISWDTLNVGKYIEGKIVNLNSKDTLIRSLSGGNSYVDYTNKRVVSSLLHGEGTDGNTSFIDSSPNPKVWTNGGNSIIKTSDYKFGTSSMYFDGVSDYITTPNCDDFNFGYDDFTIDFWFKQTKLKSSFFMGQIAPGATLVSFYIMIYADGTINLTFKSSSTSLSITSINKITDLTSFHHLACVRDDINIKLYVDGIQWGTGIINKNAIINLPNNLSIGRGGEYSANYFQGYIDEVRIIKYKSEYTTNFTPPTKPYLKPTNTFTGELSSTTDKGLGAYPEINEWDTYIVNSDLKGKITKGDDNVWHWKPKLMGGGYYSWSRDTWGANNANRTTRGTNGGYNCNFVNYNEPVYVGAAIGFRPVLEYLESDAKATTLFY